MPYCPYCGNQAHRVYEAQPIGYECPSCQRSFDVLAAGAQKQIHAIRPEGRQGVSQDARFLVDSASMWALFTDRPFLGMAMRWMAYPERIGRDLLTLVYLTVSMVVVGAVLALMVSGLLTVQMVGLGLVGLVVLVIALCVVALRKDRSRLSRCEDPSRWRR